jgi:hypothetical protein
MEKFFRIMPGNMKNFTYSLVSKFAYSADSENRDLSRGGGQ